jgi:cytochrome c biogenesis protein CcdA
METVISIFTALWIGIVTSISPCPLATNVAAISVLTRKVGNKRRALLGALAYTIGRICVYLALALMLFTGLTSMPSLSAFLRSEIPPLVGPILILAGMAVLGWLPLPVNLKIGNEKVATKLANLGLLGEFCLGGMFALSFCPVSAALFFGSLMPLAMASSFPPVPVALYGLGTALPVGLIALLIVVSSEKASMALSRMETIQGFAVRITGIVLIGIGIWLTLTETLEVI